MNWFAILVIAGIFLNLFVLAYLLDAIGRDIHGINNKLYHIYDKIEMARKEMNRK